MKDTAHEHIFDTTRNQAELQRLQAIETVFDLATKRRLASIGIAPSWRCLEVRHGAGSILH